ncbi:MAG: PQQ-dependent sugar dehydrogenase [Planctomycetota bacterium]|nr:PQQ-dependent sugar dehydrogenase [Planctomycetota bacterium]
MCKTTLILTLSFLSFQATCLLSAQEADRKQILARYTAAAESGGNADKGKLVFESEKSNCRKCHSVGKKEMKAGPDLMVIGDKLDREQMIQSVLEPSALIHPDHASHAITTVDGKIITGVLQSQSKESIELINDKGELVKIDVKDIDEQLRSNTSLMPADLYKVIDESQFRDLVEYLTTLKQQDRVAYPGMPDSFKSVRNQAQVKALHGDSLRFDHPVCVIAKPGAKNTYMIVEQKTRHIYQLTLTPEGEKKELWADLSHEAITGTYEGVLCLAFHPDFLNNRKYYLNYHVRENDIFSPVIVERTAVADLSKDAGGASRRLLKIEQPTVLHWGGMLAFGPDGYLYIGAGDGGPQEDPLGNGQNLRLHLGKILRIDVDRQENGLPYAIPKDNPFRNAGTEALAEIWAYGFRMPWRFSWDAKTKEMYVGDIGQNLYEEINMPRLGENHGWNVYEAFTPFSRQYQRDGQSFTPPVIAYRRKHGVSVTGGYVYRGIRSPSYIGKYIFADFQKKTIWAMTQENRKLVDVRVIGEVPEKPCSFGIDHDGELLIVGYEGTIYRLVLDESVYD